MGESQNWIVDCVVFQTDAAKRVGKFSERKAVREWWETKIHPSVRYHLGISGKWEEHSVKNCGSFNILDILPMNKIVLVLKQICNFSFFREIVIVSLKNIFFQIILNKSVILSLATHAFSSIRFFFIFYFFITYLNPQSLLSECGLIFGIQFLLLYFSS